MSRPYLTAFQVAELLQLNVETVYVLIAREGLPATRVGRRWRFDESHVRRWFNDRCNDASRGGAASGGAASGDGFRGRDVVVVGVEHGIAVRPS